MSINDRLGALLPAGTTAGADLAPLTTEWVEELSAFNGADLEDQAERDAAPAAPP